MSRPPNFRRTRIPSPCKRKDVFCAEHHAECKATCTKWKVYEAFKKIERAKRETLWKREITLKQYIFENKERARKINEHHKH